MFSKVTGQALVNENATRQNVLDRLDTVIAEAQAGDWAVIFLAGHGGPYGIDWVFCAHDKVVKGQELQQRIARLEDGLAKAERDAALMESEAQARFGELKAEADDRVARAEAMAHERLSEASVPRVIIFRYTAP